MIRLVPFMLGAHEALVGPVVACLERTFGERVEVRDPGFDPAVALDERRGQYDSRRFLRLLLDDAHDAPRVLGMTGVDLFIPVLTFVFGEAQLGGRAAVVSTFRLRSEPYGIVSPPERLLERAMKEALHELGHTHGLVHCDVADCVMRSSTYVEDIDAKPARFCVDCARGVAPPGAASA